MTTITNIGTGTYPNDTTGTPLQTAGQIINANFASLNTAIGTLPVLPGIYTYATLPAASANTGKTAYTSDQGPVYSNGVGWIGVGGPTNLFVAPGSTDVQIQAAINALAATGGNVYLGAGTYTINNALVPVSGVSLIGVRQTYPSTTYIIGNAFNITGGAILVAGSATVAIASNTANLTTSGTWAAGGLPVGLLTGADFKNLAFSGFSSIAIQIGGQNNAGCAFCSFEWLFFKSCGTAMQIKNFSQCNFQHINPTACNIGGVFQSAVAYTIDQLGNSWFNDLNFDGQGANQNFNRPWIFGVDGAVANAQLNEIHATNVASYAAGRSPVSKTATLNGTTTVAIATGFGSSYPVGMPVVFSSSADANFPAGRTFFVLTQVGDNITLGNYRGGSAITAAGSTSPTIVQIGFPSLDLGGTNSAQGAITSSTFSQLDAEDPSAAVVYIENGNGVTLDISEVIQGSNYIHFTSRQSQWISLGGESGPLTIDIDGFNPGAHRLLNPRITCTAGGALGNNNGAAGIYYDYTNGIWGISLNSAGPPTVDLVHRGGQGGYLAPLVCMGQVVVGWGGSGGFTLNPSLAGCFVTNNAGAQSYTLPALASAFGLTGNGGLRFEVTNIGAGTVTINASSAILYGSGANAKTHCAIPQGASATFTADAGDGVWLVSGAIGCTIT